MMDNFLVYGNHTQLVSVDYYYYISVMNGPMEFIIIKKKYRWNLRFNCMAFNLFLIHHWTTLPEKQIEIFDFPTIFMQNTYTDTYIHTEHEPSLPQIHTYINIYYFIKGKVDISWFGSKWRLDAVYLRQR